MDQEYLTNKLAFPMTCLKSVNWKTATVLTNGLASDIPCIMQALTRYVLMHPQPR